MNMQTPHAHRLSTVHAIAKHTIDAQRNETVWQCESQVQIISSVPPLCWRVILIPYSSYPSKGVKGSLTQHSCSLLQCTYMDGPPLCTQWNTLYELALVKLTAL